MTRRATAWVTIVFAAMLAVSSYVAIWSRLGAQDATPVASPVAAVVASPIAGSVPCTALFGIAEGQACLLALNGSPDLGGFDLYIDGSLVVPGVFFASLGEFISVAAGERQFEVVPSGLSLADAVLAGRGTLGEGVAYGLSTSGAGDNLRMMIQPIDTRPLADNTARLRLVHDATDAPAVDLAIVSGVPLVRGVASGQTSPSIDVPAGTYELEVRVASADDVLLPLPGTALLPSTTYNLYLTGSPADGTLGILLAPIFVTPEIAASATPVA